MTHGQACVLMVPMELAGTKGEQTYNALMGTKREQTVKPSPAANVSMAWMIVSKHQHGLWRGFSVAL